MFSDKCEVYVLEEYIMIHFIFFDSIIWMRYNDKF
jgi:hypothetical protein